MGRAEDWGTPNEDRIRPRVSILVPSLNGARFMEQAIVSALDQSRPPDEIVVQDGGSTDDTVRILSGFGPPVIWTSEPDRGQSDALNRAFRRATGDVVGWLNADDLYAPGAIEAAVQVFLERPATDLVIGDFEIIDERGVVIRHLLARPFDRERVLRKGSCLWSGATFIRRGVFERVGGFDESLQFCMDLDFWLRLPDDIGSVHVPMVFGQLRDHAAAKSSRSRMGFLRESTRIRLRESDGDWARSGLVLAGSAIMGVTLAMAPVRYSRAYSAIRRSHKL